MSVVPDTALRASTYYSTKPDAGTLAQFNKSKRYTKGASRQKICPSPRKHERRGEDSHKREELKRYTTSPLTQKCCAGDGLFGGQQSGQHLIF